MEEIENRTKKGTAYLKKKKKRAIQIKHTQFFLFEILHINRCCFSFLRRGFSLNLPLYFKAMILQVMQRYNILN